jgi:hypothetical protein
MSDFGTATFENGTFRKAQAKVRIETKKRKMDHDHD